MKATIFIDDTMLVDCGISITQLQDAAASALSRLEHPETGEPIYINGISVTVKVHDTEKTTTVAALKANTAMPKQYSVEV